MSIRSLLSSLLKSMQQSDRAKHSAPASSGIGPESRLSGRLANNVKVLRKEFEDCSDVVFRELQMTSDVRGLVIFVDGIVKAESIQDHVLRPLLLHFGSKSGQDSSPDDLESSIVTVSQLSRTEKYADAIQAVLSGNAILLVDGFTEALILSVIGGNRRSVQEPQSEASVRGPREGFTESLRTNTSLVRFKVKTTKLKMVPFVIGTHTNTNIVLAYIEGLAETAVIEEVRKRLSAIKIDGVLESGYIEELIEDNPFSPFPQFRHSERPDSIASVLLEGDFAIFVDGTPFVLSGPSSFWKMMQASEDYYERYMIGNMLRWLRYTFLLISLLLPALYIAVTTYHQDMLPSTLILSIAASREAIPFPALVEALIMEISFEALREAGIRLPKTVGQAVSILGALVIGQAAVQAGIVSAPMVIIVSMTGIASFTIPHFNMAISVRMLRFPIMVFAGVLGMFGIVVGVLLISLHLAQLKSFGKPYLTGIAPYRHSDQKDIFVRAPWWSMIRRPSKGTDPGGKRMKKGMQPKPEGKG